MPYFRLNPTTSNLTRPKYFVRPVDKTISARYVWAKLITSERVGFTIFPGPRPRRKRLRFPRVGNQAPYSPVDKIKILNPAYPGGSITSRKRAERYVRRGVARWAGDGNIQFIADDHRHTSAMASVDRTERGYDQIGRMTLDQVQGLPCAGPAVKVFMLKSKRGNGYA